MKNSLEKNKIKKIGYIVLGLIICLILIMMFYNSYRKSVINHVTDNVLEQRHLLNKVDKSETFYSSKFNTYNRRVTFKDDKKYEYEMTVFDQPTFKDFIRFKSKKDFKVDMAVEGMYKSSVDFKAPYNFLVKDGKAIDYYNEYENL